MNLTLLKKMLPGLVPLLIFIVADEIWGTMVGLYVALGTGMAEFLFYYIKDKIIDRFILLDTLLLVVMGVISIVFENDVFFKIKPALIEAILLAIIAFSLWGPRNILMAMSERYMGEIQLDAGQEKSMRNNMVAVFRITAFHILLVLYSAFFMSKEAWFFISGGLYYIFFGIFFAYILLKNRLAGRRYRNEEWFPVVSTDGRVIGKAPRGVCHDGKSFLLHPVVHLHVFNHSGNLYLQKRSMKKDTQPGKWDTSVGGHIASGESVTEALVRESREELGLNGFKPQFLASYVWESPVEKELVNSFTAVTGQMPEIDHAEIDEGRFWSVQEIRSKLGKGIFTPNFEHEFKMFLAEPGNMQFLKNS